jgi:ligand-binding SRPBCC domain-containing protein
VTEPDRKPRLERTQRFARPIEEVFAFFCDPGNLARITPARLRFRIVERPDGPLFEGAEIEYRIRVRGIPVSWRSRITAWEPPHRFVDEQIRGPYRTWIHEHLFERDGDGTLVRDRVRYGVPGGSLIDRLLVRPDLERIFDFRRERLGALLGPGQT